MIIIFVSITSVCHFIAIDDNKHVEIKKNVMFEVCILNFRPQKRSSCKINSNWLN